MKTSTKRVLTAVILLTVFTFAVNAQTNVSGGIFSNTTWTLANSPYIVVDTVVVFPNVTLTIEPGVVVQFDNDKLIEVRQARLIANGTSVLNPITFTSNTSTTPGSYSGIYLNGGSLTSIFNYCNFRYANVGIKVTVLDSIIVKNSNFNQDSTGLKFAGNSASSVALIDSSIFNNNIKEGLDIMGVYYAGINHCNFNYNGVNGMNIDYSLILRMTYCNFSNNGTGLLWFMRNSIMNHCNFSNNGVGFQSNEYFSNLDTYNNIVENCLFDSNQTGVKDIGFTLIDSCTITHNQTGYIANLNRIKNCTVDSNSVTGISSFNDSVINCSIKYNGTGIAGSNIKIIGNDIEYSTGVNISCSGTTSITGNTIRYGSVGIDATGSLVITGNIIDNNNLGINLSSSNATISCNRICNNSTYDLKYLVSANLDASHNYWCTPDSSSTESVIYDGYDNINYGLVGFMPFDSACSPIATSINTLTQENLLFNIYPNPTADYLTIELPGNDNKTEIKIINMLGKSAYSSIINKQKATIDVSSFASGMYTVQIAADGAVSKQKFIKQ